MSLHTEKSLGLRLSRTFKEHPLILSHHGHDVAMPVCGLVGPGQGSSHGGALVSKTWHRQKAPSLLFRVATHRPSQSWESLSLFLCLLFASFSHQQCQSLFPSIMRVGPAPRALGQQV